MSSRRSRTRQSASGGSRVTDEQIYDLVSKLQKLLTELTNTHSDKVSAAKVLQEACNYVTRLHKEVYDLSERLSELLTKLTSSGVCLCKSQEMS